MTSAERGRKGGLANTRERAGRLGTPKERCTYRVTHTGDGAGLEYFQSWKKLVLHLVEHLGEPQSVVEDMIFEGLDGSPGWDGERVHLQFEDGSTCIEKGKR